MKNLASTIILVITLAYSVSGTDQTLAVEVEGKGYVSSFPAGILCGVVCSEAYNTGTTITLTAKPDEGERLISWDGCSSASGNACIVSLDSSRKVAAKFSGTVKKSFRLSVSKTGSGSIDSEPSGADCGLIACSSSYGDFPSGTEVRLTAKPSSDSDFVNWEGDCTGTEKTCTVIMDSAKSVTAQFSKSANPLSNSVTPLQKTEKVTLTLGRIGFGRVRTIPEGINCPPNCEARFDKYQTIKVIAEEPEGVKFERWFLGCEGANQTSCQTAFGYDNKIIAKFSGTPKVMPSQKRTLTVTNDYDEFGTVTSNPAGINCGRRCVAEFADGQPVELSAVPKEGFEVGYWSGDCEGYKGNCTVGMDSDRTASTSFLKLIPLSVTAKVVGHGRVVSDPIGLSCPPDCERREFRAGYNITYIAIPDEGAKFIGWEGSCRGASAKCQIFYLNQIAFDEVTAKFSEQKLQNAKVTINVKGSGAVVSSPSGISCPRKCTAIFKTSQNIEFKAIAPKGVNFTGWEDDCTGLNSSCTIGTGRDAKVTATFTQKPSLIRRILGRAARR